MTAFIRHIDTPSFVAGLGCGLALAIMILLMSRLGRPFLKLALAGVVVTLLIGSYFGWVRRRAGLGDHIFSDPRVLVDDAKEAVDKMNARMREQQKMIEDLQRSP